MKKAPWFTRAAVVLALQGVALPQLASAQGPAPRRYADPAPAPVAPSAAAVTDVALAEGGMLTGQVVGDQGTPLANVPISVRQLERVVATAQTNQDGRFSVSGLGGGVYQITAGEGVGTYRLWAPQTAPPAAQPAALIVSGSPLVRGQDGGGGLRYWLTNPWILAGVIGAAIAVPIALNNREHISTS